MSQNEVLIPKMRRTEKKHPEFNVPIVNIALILFFLMLIVGSTFINITLKHFILPSGFWHGANLSKEDFIFTIQFIPQIPILMFVCSSLGKKMALSTVILYIILGLTLFPIFGMGGGIKYIAQYSFGYILAYIPAVVIAGQFLRKKYTFLTMLYATVSGVLIIHIIGILYMILMAIIHQDGWQFITGWISAQSGLKIIYDLIFSYVLVLIGKYLNSFIKFTLA